MTKEIDSDELPVFEEVEGEDPDSPPVKFAHKLAEAELERSKRLTEPESKPKVDNDPLQ